MSMYHREFETLCYQYSQGKIGFLELKEAIKALGLRYAL